MVKQQQGNNEIKGEPNKHLTENQRIEIQQCGLVKTHSGSLSLCISYFKVRTTVNLRNPRYPSIFAPLAHMLDKELRRRRAYERAEN